MTISRFNPPMEYLQAASRASLQSFELARLNHAANLRAEVAALLDQWIQETSEALLARWMLDHHKPLPPSPMTFSDVVCALTDPAALPLPEPPSPPVIASAPPRFAAQRPTLRESLSRKPQKQRQASPE